MKIFFVSLGCDKNLVDTEQMLGLLQEKGYTFTDSEEEADIAVVNTCCFIGDAKEESINALLELAAYKQNGHLKLLVATGCLAQRYHEEIRKDIPEVDVIIGTTAIDVVAEAIDTAMTAITEATRQKASAVGGEKTWAQGILESGTQGTYCRDIHHLPLVDTHRVLTTGGHYAYLKIAEGCNKHCTYCIIPKVRGDFRSVPMERLVAEATKLAEAGVKELILVAQETTLYGQDLYGEKSLHKLLDKLAEISGIYWIRILYCYPEEITDELIEAIATNPKVVHYLDIPIQHASDPVLKRMGRRTNQAQLREIIGKLRSRIPDICLRTTLISGFPGETQEDYEEVYRFINEMEFDRLGVFAYSREEDTPAAILPNQIPEKVKAERRDELMELQQAIAFEKAEDMTGRILDVMIEGSVADEDVYVARTYRDAPGVDGYLFLNTTANLVSGDFVKVLVTDSNEYDLIGEIYYE